MRKMYVHLTVRERDLVAVFKVEGLSRSEIARRIGRDKSTVSRELGRNAPPVHTGYYLSHRAHERARERWFVAHQRERLKNNRIRAYVVYHLKLGWSPEIIAGRLPLDVPGERVSHEAIYQYVYEDRKDLVPCLVRRHRKRLRKGYTRKHQKAHIPNRIPVSERSKVAGLRKRVGDWEADSVVSQQSKAALNVLVDRRARLVRITKIRRKTAEQTSKTIQRVLGEYPPHARRTITYDNGSENTMHEEINKALGTASYFCEPYRSWEKGSVENRIGVVRRQLPKRTDFATVSSASIKNIEDHINNMPMKCLKYKTPQETFTQSIVALTH